MQVSSYSKKTTKTNPCFFGRNYKKFSCTKSYENSFLKIIYRIVDIFPRLVFAFLATITQLFAIFTISE